MKESIREADALEEEEALEEALESNGESCVVELPAEDYQDDTFHVEDDVQGKDNEVNIEMQNENITIEATSERMEGLMDDSKEDITIELVSDDKKRSRKRSKRDAARRESIQGLKLASVSSMVEEMNQQHMSDLRPTSDSVSKISNPTSHLPEESHVTRTQRDSIAALKLPSVSSVVLGMNLKEMNQQLEESDDGSILDEELIEKLAELRSSTPVGILSSPLSPPEETVDKLEEKRKRLFHFQGIQRKKKWKAKGHLDYPV